MIDLLVAGVVGIVLAASAFGVGEAVAFVRARRARRREHTTRPEGRADD